MNAIMKAGLVLVATATLGLAESWSGQLVSADCKSQAESTTKADDAQSCVITPTTKVFAVQTPDGKVYKLDSAGNEKVLSQMKGDFTSQKNITVTGSLNGNMMKVDSIDLK